MKNNFKTHFLYKIMEKSLLNLPTPSSISYLWNWGSILGFSMLIQIISGILLSSHYNPSIKEAFNSISHIMRDINWGYELRFIHMNMASMLFIYIFIHISRNLMKSSYKLKEVWVSGVMILLTMMATSFLGYVLPWGQMSFWGATVITNLLSAIPIFGVNIVEWLWGGFSINNSTLNRFFSLHFLLPFMMLAMIILHLMSLHQKGSNKPLGANPNTDKIPFHPFFSMKDMAPIMTLMMILMLISSMKPFMLSDPENFNLANPLNTPIHIQPEWYFLFAYAILRSIPNKLGGVIALVLSILILIPLVMLKKMKSSKKWMPNLKFLFWSFSSTFLMLTWIGAKPVEQPFEEMGKMFSVLYFMVLVLNCF